MPFELEKINILIGNNGCGKTTILKEIEKQDPSYKIYHVTDVTKIRAYLEYKLFFLKYNFNIDYKNIIGVFNIPTSYKLSEDSDIDVTTISDGGIRYLNLLVFLSQPIHLLPDIILIDEIELGLEHTALHIIAERINVLTRFDKKIVIATQSTEFINNFKVEDILMVKWWNNKPLVKRLKESDYSVWFDLYNIGDLYIKNIIGEHIFPQDLYGDVK